MRSERLASKRGITGEGEREDLPSLTLRLEKSEDVVLPDGSLYVPDDRTGRVVHELYANLGNSSTGTSAAENLDNLGELDRDLVRSRLLLIHDVRKTEPSAPCAERVEGLHLIKVPVSSPSRLCALPARAILAPTALLFPA